MRKSWAVIVLLAVLGITLPAKAQQNAAKLKAYAGYDYIRFNINANVSGFPPSESFNANGGGGQLAFNANNWLGVVGEPLRRQSVHPRYFVGHGPSQLQAQNLREELVVSKPRTLRVYRHDKCVCILQLEEQLLGAGVPGHEVGQFAIDPVKYRRAE